MTAPVAPHSYADPPEAQLPVVRKRGLLWFYVAAGSLLAVLAVLACTWGRILTRYDVARLRTLRARGEWPEADTDHLFWRIFTRGVVKQGMSYEEVVEILGRPQPARDSMRKERDELDPVTGRRVCTWIARECPYSFEFYTVTFDPEGRADFVPYVKSRRRDPGSGLTVVELVKDPAEEPQAVGEESRQ